MTHDARGLAVTTDSDDVIRAIDHFSYELLSQGPGVGAIIDAAAAHPEYALLQAYAAALYVYAQSSGEALKAKPPLERGRMRFDSLTERERLFIDVVEAGCGADFARALTLCEELTVRWPRDVVASKLAEFHLFETGDAARQLRFMERIAEPNADSSHALAMYAFALELNGRRRKAEAVARNALAMDPATMWAQHSLAHVFAGESRTDDGIAEMRSFAPTWNAFRQYIIAHNSFHLATLYLANLSFDETVAALRERTWGFTPDLVVEHTDAILLWFALSRLYQADDMRSHGIAELSRRSAGHPVGGTLAVNDLGGGRGHAQAVGRAMRVASLQNASAFQ